MKKIKIFITLFIGFSVLINAQEAIRIPMGQNIGKSEKIPVSKIAESIRFIPLETNRNCLFDTDISKIEIFEETLFVSDYNYIFRYDLNGKFLNRIGKKGRGPGEYAPAFQSFLIDKINRNLIIFDMNSKRMIKYDFDGNFVKEEKINFLPGKMEWITDDNFAVYNMGFTYEKEPWHDFYILTSDAKTIQKKRFKKESGKRYGLIIYPPVFYRFKGKTRYKNPHENIIYEIDEKGKVSPVYYLDYGKYEKYNDADDVEVQVKNNVGTNRSNPDSFEKIGLLGLSETEDYLFIYYGHQEQRKAGVFDKRENTFYNLFDSDFDLFGFQDDLYNGLPVFPKVGINDSFLITSYTAMEFKEFLKGKGKTESNLKKTSSDLDENNNPVLMLVKLKE
ncbi:6-bladed beta-propeller [Maribellus comscasis]|uniref:6-bladed beta-propeller n=1 Tax=Maribellus comscasis TaxID=2681766 RepID=A0A6I6K3J7_9BACT|nr:6-bladed beta-propeller [Maribellus comscasis]QGY46992.1 6-bladed beta-propeller [Maribellus comscasis]